MDDMYVDDEPGFAKPKRGKKPKAQKKKKVPNLESVDTPDSTAMVIISSLNFINLKQVKQFKNNLLWHGTVLNIAEIFLCEIQTLYGV